MGMIVFFPRDLFHRIRPCQRLTGGSKERPKGGLRAGADEILGDQFIVELDGDALI